MRGHKEEAENITEKLLLMGEHSTKTNKKKSRKLEKRSSMNTTKQKGRQTKDTASSADSRKKPRGVEDETREGVQVRSPGRTGRGHGCKFGGNGRERGSFCTELGFFRSQMFKSRVGQIVEIFTCWFLQGKKRKSQKCAKTHKKKFQIEGCACASVCARFRKRTFSPKTMCGVGSLVGPGSTDYPLAKLEPTNDTEAVIVIP